MVLKQNRIVRYEYENSLREDILLSKKERLLSSGLVINDNEIDQAFRREYEKIEVEYIYFDPQSFTKKINIEETELRKYHQDHPHEFQTLNQFQIEYFIISGGDFQGNINIREREIKHKVCGLMVFFC
jgi:peptidyl-prolyl cis-trans isomerase D